MPRRISGIERGFGVTLTVFRDTGSPEPDASGPRLVPGRGPDAFFGRSPFPCDAAGCIVPPIPVAIVPFPPFDTHP